MTKCPLMRGVHLQEVSVSGGSTVPACDLYICTVHVCLFVVLIREFDCNVIFFTFPGGSLHLCGSSSNGFGDESSDADFCFILTNLRQV